MNKNVLKLKKILCTMYVPTERVGKTENDLDLIWLKDNLVIANGHHLDYQKAINLIEQLLDLKEK